MRKKAIEIVRGLENSGWRFTSSSQTTVGDWTPSDADWNYRDIPHLNVVHTQVEGVLALAEQDISSSILVQKLGPVRTLLPAVLMCDSNTGQVYFTAVAGIALVIDTSWETGEHGVGCKVVTTYFVGTRLMLTFLRPLIHRALARNYRILMSEDIPMRNQRAYLRKRGFAFRQDFSGHSYVESMKIATDNVIMPQSNEPIVFSLGDVGNSRTQLWNPEETRSIAVSLEDGNLLIYPAICPHEGANLTIAACNQSGRIECPWHGRAFSPLVSLPVGEMAAETLVSFNFDSLEISVR